MNGNLNSKSPLLWIGLFAFICIVLLCMMNIWHLVSGSSSSQPLILTSVMMVGLALIVGLVILLLIFFKATDTEDKTQALGLPPGSIRALIALALVLMFVCMGVYLYQGVANNGAEVTKHGLTKVQVDALKAQFSLVIDHPAPPPPTPPPSDPTKPPSASEPLFDVTYYTGRSKEADDLAKQIFTQLATVFVTVIGFYFGSSTATAGVGAGVAAASAASGGGTSAPHSGVPAALQEAKALTLDAVSGLTSIQTLLSHLPPDSPIRSSLENVLGDAQKTVETIRAKVKAANDAANKFGTASTDAENSAAAADVIKARDEIKPLLAAVKASVDKATSMAPPTPTGS